jgi:hypothetical protein
MKKILLFCSLLVMGILRAQPTYVAEWQVAVPSSSSSGKHLGGVALTVDASTGEIFTIGSFCNTINFGPGNSLTSTGGTDVYVAKFDASGAIIKAVKLGSSSDDTPYSIAFQAGYVFVSWYDGGGSGGGKITKLSNVSSSLSTLSTCNLGTNVYPHSIFAYGTVNVLIGGSFTDDAYLPTGGTAIHLTASNWASCGGCYDSFVASLTASSNVVNTAANPNYSTASNEVMAIYCRNGRVYTTGYFKGDIRWSSGGTLVSASGVQDAFIASVYLNPLFPQTIGSFNNDLLRAGSNESTPGSGAGDPYWKECGYGINVNSSAIYVTGNLNTASTPTFGSTSFSNGGGAFVARINIASSNVGTANWVRATYDCSSGLPQMASIGYGVATDANGDVFATGKSATYALMTDGTTNICVGGSGSPGFISQFNSTGSLLTADAINQSANITTYTEGRAITIFGCEAYSTGISSNDGGGSFSVGNRAAISTSTNTAMYLFDINTYASVASNVKTCASCGSFPVTVPLSVSGGAPYNWSGTPTALSFLSSTTSSAPTFSMTACTSAGIYDYSISTSGTCRTIATVSVAVGPSATGQANAGPDKLVCPGHTYVLGTAGQPGLTYSWLTTGYLDNPSLAQPTFTPPVSGLPITYTLTVTDYCGNTSVDYVTIDWDPSCPHRMANPDLNNNSIAEIYPNPSAGVFNLDLLTSENETEVIFEVTDLAGRVVQQNKITTSGGTQTIDLSKEGKGIYLLRVIRDGQVEIHRLIVE